MKKVIVLISFLCGAFFVSAQQGNQQQRQQERWKPEYPAASRSRLAAR